MGKTSTKTIILGIMIAAVFILGILTIDFASANHPQQAGYRFTQFVEDLASHFPITSADIVDGTITSADIADETITGADVADSSITSNDILLGSLDIRYARVTGDTFSGSVIFDSNVNVGGIISGDGSGLTNLPAGATGATGATGPAGSTGPAGATGLAGTDTLGSLSCTTDQIARWTGSAWACVNQFDYSSPQTRTTTFGASSLNPDGESEINFGNFFTEAGLQCPSSACRGYTHIDIPDGATIKEFRCTVDDNHAVHDISCRLTKSVLGIAVGVKIAGDLISTGSSGIQTLTQTGLSEVVDRDTTSYSAQYAHNFGCGFSCQFRAFQIVYDVSGTD